MALCNLKTCFNGVILKREVNRIGKGSQWEDSIAKVIMYSSGYYCLNSWTCCNAYSVQGIFYLSICLSACLPVYLPIIYWKGVEKIAFQKMNFQMKLHYVRKKELAWAAGCELCMFLHSKHYLCLILYCHFCHPDLSLMGPLHQPPNWYLSFQFSLPIQSTYCY